MLKFKLFLLIGCAITLLLFVFSDLPNGVGSFREEPDREDMTDVELEERFQLRRKRMRSICKRTENREDVISTFETQVLYFWKQNISICTMGKVGSGTWRRHTGNINNISMHHVLNDPNRRSLLKQPWEKIVSYSHSLSKWITVRHPLTRLVSCYQDKYRNGSVRQKEGKLVSEFVLPAFHSNGLMSKSRPKPSITFEEFLKHVVNSFKEGTDNRHWKTYGVLCSPCYFDYDYITKTETQRKDLEYLFRKFSVPSDPNVERKVRMDVKEKMKKDFKYFKNIPMDLKRKIYDIYKIDMAMFGYELPPDYWESPKAQ